MTCSFLTYGSQFLDADTVKTLDGLVSSYAHVEKLLEETSDKRIQLLKTKGGRYIIRYRKKNEVYVMSYATEIVAKGNYFKIVKDSESPSSDSALAR